MLRKATLEDFATFKMLFEDKECRYQWLYYNSSKIDLQNPDSEETSQTGWECEEIEEYYNNYTVERFKDDLNTIIIFVEEVDGKVVGYITLDAWSNRAKLMEWALLDSDDEQMKEQMFSELLKQRLSRVSVIEISPCDSQAISWVEAHGFEKTGPCYYKLQLSKKGR